MSDEERTLLDARGDLLYAVRGGETNEGAGWQSCRFVLTDRRLVVATDGNKQAVPLAKARLEDEPPSVPAADGAREYTAVRIGDNVVFVSVPDDVDFRVEFCRASLHDEVVLVKHPAVEGGVVQDVDWEKAKFRFVEGTVRMALPEGSVAIGTDDVGTIDTARREVRGPVRTVVQVEHTEGDRSVETHLTGTDRHARALAALFERAVARNEASVDELDDLESQVLMALYSGVSPFEMADFVGIPPEEVEGIYQRLLAMGAVDEVRTRTEVVLNARGRNLASEAMSEQ